MNLASWLRTGLRELARLSSETLLSREALKPRLEDLGVPSPEFSSIINPTRLCFLHVPKTAGASIISVLDSMFDDNQIARAYNPPDYDNLGESLRNYNFVRGHLLGSQYTRYIPDFDLFTILREPADLAISMYRWIRAYKPDDWDQWSKDGRRVAGDDTELQNDNAKATKIALDNSLEALLSMNERVIEARFKHILLRSLTNGRRFDVLEDQKAKAHELLKRCVIVGDFADLEMALWLICAARKWPAPPPLPQIHVNETPSRAGAEIIRLTRLHSPVDHELYAAARDLAAAAADHLLGAAQSRARIREYLNEQHKNYILTNAPASPFIELDATQVWPGYGWTPRVVESDSFVYKGIGQTGVASILAKLVAGLHYLVLVDVPRIYRQEATALLEAKVGSTRLRRIAANQSRQGVRFVWELSQDTVSMNDGCMEIDFVIPPHLVEPLPFVLRRVTVQISPYAH